jgi:hypothetical protein
MSRDANDDEHVAVAGTPAGTHRGGVQGVAERLGAV